MAVLEIQFNCMCAFVPDATAGAVHVLMPTTEGHSHHHPGPAGQPGAPVEQHVVRLLHRTLPPEGVPMEGWALELGDGRVGPQGLTLEPATRFENETIVDISELTGRPIPRRLLEDTVQPEVSARVTLRAGRVDTAQAEARWKFRGVDLEMAFRVTWRIDEVSDGPLTWVRLGATGDPPVRSLRDLGADDDGVFRIQIYHVPGRALPPDEADLGNLEPLEVKDHFRALYVLVGIDQPGEDILPQPPADLVGNAHCGVVTGSGS